MGAGVVSPELITAPREYGPQRVPGKRKRREGCP